MNPLGREHLPNPLTQLSWTEMPALLEEAEKGQMSLQEEGNFCQRKGMEAPRRVTFGSGCGGWML